MTRDELRVEIVARLGEMLSAANIATTDTSGALKEPIDDALKAVGFAYGERASAEIVAGDEDTAVREGEIAALRRILNALAMIFTVSSEGDRVELSAMFAQATKRLDDLLAERVAVGWSASVELAYATTSSLDEFGAEDEL